MATWLDNVLTIEEDTTTRDNVPDLVKVEGMEAENLDRDQDRIEEGIGIVVVEVVKEGEMIEIKEETETTIGEGMVVVVGQHRLGGTKTKEDIRGIGQDREIIDDSG